MDSRTSVVNDQIRVKPFPVTVVFYRDDKEILKGKGLYSLQTTDIGTHVASVHCDPWLIERESFHYLKLDSVTTTTKMRIHEVFCMMKQQKSYSSGYYPFSWNSITKKEWSKSINEQCNAQFKRTRIEVRDYVTGRVLSSAYTYFVDSIQAELDGNNWIGEFKLERRFREDLVEGYENYEKHKGKALMNLDNSKYKKSTFSKICDYFSKLTGGV